MRVNQGARPVLVVDDEPHILKSIAGALASAGIGAVVACDDARKVLGLLEATAFGAVLLDLTMPHVPGTELLPAIKKRFPGLPVIIVTGVNEVGAAVGCMRDGAFDYLVKAIDNDALSASVRRALDFTSLCDENRALRDKILSPGVKDRKAFSAMVTDSEAMEAVFRYAETVAPTGRTVLIVGQTGTGKELLAEAVHALSGRVGPLVKVNVAGLDDAMFTDALFGHRKGAYSGADEPRKGLVESAAGGTLFLDEIGDLQPQTQVKLLRLIDNGEYYPLGSDVLKKVDCRIVAATNKPLSRLADPEVFRPDLYYRLASHAMELPPLSDRRGDAPLLFDLFIAEACQEFGKPLPSVSAEAYAVLDGAAFPGNVRELRSMAFDCVGRLAGPEIGLAELPSRFGAPSAAPSAHGRGGSADGARRGPDEAGGGGRSFAPQDSIRYGERLPTLKEATDSLVAEALSRTGGNISAAARLLGVTQSALSKRLSRAADQDGDGLSAL